MIKKKILFVIPNLGAGGAEKSLVNLLNTFDPERYTVDLFLFSHSGLFFDQIPKFVNILPLNKTMVIFQKSLKNSLLEFIRRKQFGLAFNRITFALLHRIVRNGSYAEQYAWKYLSESIDNLPVIYDSAVAFLEKSSIYFTVEKVLADKKIGWVHNDYNKLRLNKNFDHFYFKNLTYLVTVSEECKDVLLKEFPDLKDKVNVIYNINSSLLIKKLSDVDSFIYKLKPNFISIGRLHPQKGFDLAIEAAKILKSWGIYFNWYVIGEGSERAKLEGLIDKYELKNQFHLLGMKQNPYAYLKNADIFLQTSLYEGKSIAVDEAKILGKPIILTNFSTAKDQIIHEYNGIICEMTAEGIALAIVKYLENSELKNKIINNLKFDTSGTEGEIKKLYRLIENQIV